MSRLNWHEWIAAALDWPQPLRLPALPNPKPITASELGNKDYADATPVPQSFTINKATETINVAPYTVTYDGNPHTATATATGVGGVDLSADLNLTGMTGLELLAAYARQVALGFAGLANILDPEVIATKFLNVVIETRGEYTIGRTVVDHEKRTTRPPNCHVALGADRARFFEMLMTTFAKPGRS